MQQTLAESPRSYPRARPIEVLGDGSFRVFAPAKINLNLLVGRRRQDGYHSLDSIVAKVSLYDEIEFRPRDDGELLFAAEGMASEPDEGNLAYRAAMLLSPEAGIRGAEIRLTKAIPIGRGLGGGSADAAAALAGLNELWRLKLPADRLAKIGASLGSDVPLFFGPAASRMTGRGDNVEPIRVHPFFAILLLPPFGCSTAAVYRAFDDAPREPGEQLDVAALTGPPSRWRGGLVNQLARAAGRVQPRVAEILSELGRALRVPVQLTGSGSAMFLLCDDLAEARVLASMIPSTIGCRKIVVESNPW